MVAIVKGEVFCISENTLFDEKITKDKIIIAKLLEPQDLPKIIGSKCIIL